MESSSKLYLLKQGDEWLDACGDIWKYTDIKCSRCEKETKGLYLSDDVLQFCPDCLEAVNMELVTEDDKAGYTKWLANCEEYGSGMLSALVKSIEATGDIVGNIDKIISVLQSMLVYAQEMKRINGKGEANTKQ